MTEESIKRQPRRVWRSIFRVLGYGALLVVFILVVAHFAWKYSGSSQWEPVLDKKGVKIYSMKTPGSTLKDWKATRRVKLSMNRAIAAMVSTQSADCAEWFPGCQSVKAVQPWNPQDLTYVHMFRMPFPPPFSPREVVIDAKASQDPQTKAVLIKFGNRPNAVPLNDCCFRVMVYDNSWRFTPVGNGEVEVELIMHADQGVPYPMVNHFAPQAIYSMFRKLPRLLNKEKWQHATFHRIQDV